jgi:hypothetical protein
MGLGCGVDTSRKDTGLGVAVQIPLDSFPFPCAERSPSPSPRVTASIKFEPFAGFGARLGYRDFLVVDS